MHRRMFISGLLCSAAIPAQAGQGQFEFTRSDPDWRAILTKVEYAVMRQGATETAYSSPLNYETRDGVYHCKGCNLPVYSSAHKYDSGTGWPSFWQSLEGAVGTKPDHRLFATRTEVHCRRCGSHLGHIFDDGPAPTGQRHCLNGVSLIFRA